MSEEAVEATQAPTVADDGDPNLDLEAFAAKSQPSGEDGEGAPAPEGESVEEGQEEEAEAEEAEAEEAEEPAWSKKFKERAARDRKRVQEQRRLAEEREAQKKKLELADEYERLRQNAKLNPREALEALGVSYKETTDFILNEEKPTPDLQYKALVERHERLEQEFANYKQQQEAAALERSQQEYLDTYNDAVSQIVSGNEDYKIVDALGRYDLVLSVSLDHQEKTGEVLDLEAAVARTAKLLEQDAMALKQAMGWGDPPSSEESPKAEVPRANKTLKSQTSGAIVAKRSVDEMDDDEAIEFLARRG